MSLLPKIIFLFIISSFHCNLQSYFPKQSLYFKSLDNLLPDTLNNTLFTKDYFTNLIIAKYEKEQVQPVNFSHNTMSFYINSLYYHNIICLDTKAHFFYTLKNKVQHHVSTFNYKNSDSYTEVSDNEYFCLEREEYIDKNINLHEKNSLIEENFFYNLINTANTSKSSIPLIEKLTDISLINIHKEIKETFGKIFQWNNNCSYELTFFYDTTKDKFILSKVFVFYQGSQSFTLKALGLDHRFSEVVIDAVKTNNQFSYSKKTDQWNIKPLNNQRLFSKEMIKIKTNKKDSVYHNTMTIQLQKNIIDDTYDVLGIKDKNEKLCYMIHEVLTEDVYIEKNEFRHFIDDYLKIPYELHASQFIEQELSSDLSQQAYFSFFFCANSTQIKNINYTIKFPIHYRYQPSLKAASTLTHQTVIMPAPFFSIHPYNNYSTILFHNLLYNLNSPITSIGSIKTFQEDLTIKLNILLNKQHLLISNYNEFSNQIPAGQMKYFDIIAKVTSLSSIIGFALILYGIFKYNYQQKYKGKSKIE